MVLLLRNHEIRGLMDLSDYISAVEDGYRELGTGMGTAFPRENLWIKGEKRDSHYGGHLPAGSKASFKFKAGLLPGLSGAGVNAYTAGLYLEALRPICSSSTRTAARSLPSWK